MPNIDGLISGLDTTGLINNILKFQQQPITQMQTRIKETTDRKTALLSFTARLVGLESKANFLVQAAAFASPTVASSNEDVLKASGGENLPTGSYGFRIKRLAASTQYTSSGYATTDTKVGAGSIRIDAAGGSIDRQSDLDILNGGAGVRRGTIRITNRQGVSALIDLSSAITVNDVLDAINNAPGLNITAAVAGRGAARPGEAIILTDSSGGAGSLKVEDVSGGNTAKDLGLRTSVAASTLEGGSIAVLGAALSLAPLNDGLGVRLQAGADLQISQRDGTVFTVDLSGKSTVGEVLAAINSAAGNTGVTMAVAGRRLVATDASAGAGAFTIGDVGSGHAATDLGLAQAASGGTITGTEILAGLGTVLLKNLHGGVGVAMGSILVTGRTGASEQIDLTAARTIQEAVDGINANSIGVAAALNDAGDGIILRDGSGGSGLFSVQEVGGGTTAAGLGILLAGGVAADEIDGGDLKMQSIGENTLLKSINGGRGVAAGSIRITDPTGRSFIVDLSQEKTVGEVLKDINGAAGLAASDVTAALNSDGNGILLRAATGDGSLMVSEMNGGTTAKDLNLAGSAPEADRRTIDGSFERTIQVSAEDTLDTLVERINNLGIGITASILDDGSATAPKRLQLVSDRPGAAGRIIVRGSDGTSLGFNRIAEGYDAVLFLGGQGGRPMVIRSSTNEFRDVVKGLTVTAKAVSETPITVTATRDLEKVRTAIQDLVDTYNEVMDEIRDLTRFDVTTGSKGPLLGESSLRNVERQVSTAILRPVLGMGVKENLASQIGLRVTAQGKLSFKEDEFDAVAASNPDSIRGIFTQYRPLDDRVKLADFGNGEGVTLSSSGPELRIQRRDGTTLDVDLTGDTNVRELLASINEATGNNGTVKATLSTDSRSILLTDSTVGVTAFSVKSLNGSPAYRQLGLDIGADSAGGGVMTGRKIDLQGDYGVARRLADVLKTLTDSTGGLLSTRAENFQSQIDELNKRMESKKESMAAREEQLRRQFAQLEIIMGQNQNTLQRLTAALTSK